MKYYRAIWSHTGEERVFKVCRNQHEAFHQDRHRLIGIHWSTVSQRLAELLASLKGTHVIKYDPRLSGIWGYFDNPREEEE